MGAISRSSPRRLRARLRRDYVFELRLRGASFREIAEGIHARGRREGWKLPKNYGNRQAHQDLMRYLEDEGRQRQREVELRRAIAMERCNRLLRSVWPEVMAGKRGAIAEARRLRVRLRRQLVHRLRVEGATYSEIAERVRGWAGSRGWELPKGYDKRNVWQDLQRYLKERGRRHEDEVRLQAAIRLERYEMLLAQVLAEAMRGSLTSVDQAIRIMDKIDELEQLL